MLDIFSPFFHISMNDITISLVFVCNYFGCMSQKICPNRLIKMEVQVASYNKNEEEGSQLRGDRSLILLETQIFFFLLPFLVYGLNLQNLIPISDHQAFSILIQGKETRYTRLRKRKNPDDFYFYFVLSVKPELSRSHIQVPNISLWQKSCQLVAATYLKILKIKPLLGHMLSETKSRLCQQRIKTGILSRSKPQCIS